MARESATPAESERVDVVVPVFRPGEWLEVCLDSVTASTGVAVAIFVVDDDPSAPVDARWIGARWPNAVLLHQGKNSGFAAACNRGIAAGNAPYVLVLNQDARVASDFVSRLVRRMRDDTTLAAVGGKVLHQPTARADPDNILDSAGIEMRRGRRSVDIGQGETDMGQYDGLREVFGICAAAALYRRAALATVALGNGPFDEAFFMHKEDVDLAWRLRAASYRAAVDGKAVAYHARGTRRGADIPGQGVRAWSERALALVRQERVKSPAFRIRAWRNQMRMLARNETPADFVRSFADFVGYQAISLIFGLVLDPRGTVASRVRFVAEMPHLIGQRRRTRPHAASLRDWLP